MWREGGWQEHQLGQPTASYPSASSLEFWRLMMSHLVFILQLWLPSPPREAWPCFACVHCLHGAVHYLRYERAEGPTGNREMAASTSWLARAGVAGRPVTHSNNCAKIFPSFSTKMMPRPICTRNRKMWRRPASSYQLRTVHALGEHREKDKGNDLQHQTYQQQKRRKTQHGILWSTSFSRISRTLPRSLMWPLKSSKHGRHMLL